jgi:hypothetical protein
LILECAFTPNPNAIKRNTPNDDLYSIPSSPFTMKLYYAQLLALLLLSPTVVEGSLRGVHGSDSGSNGKIHFTNGFAKKRRLRAA